MDIKTVIKSLEGSLDKISVKEGKRLNEINAFANELVVAVNKFEILWEGGWGQEDYNQYTDPPIFALSK
jgi:predicted transglutaminase-like cysteine proteinase